MPKCNCPERIQVRATVFLVSGRKQPFQRSNTRLQSPIFRLACPEIITGLLLSQRFDPLHFIRPEPHSGLVLVDRAHPAVAQPEQAGQPAHPALVVHRRPTAAGVVPHGCRGVDTHLATLVFGSEIQHFGFGLRYVFGHSERTRKDWTDGLH